MAVQRDDPYRNFPFLVDLGPGPKLGFSEVLLGASRIEPVLYREGADLVGEARKLPGRATTDNVVLRRGITGDLSLYQWWDATRNGDPNVRRTVRVHLLAEDRSGPVYTWKLLRAWPSVIEFGPLRGLGQEVAVETLELAYDRLELE
ncbi:MAG TPA: phage tail protein [Gaiella sp.]|nr:phage tail protein [Gaiella sp.]